MSLAFLHGIETVELDDGIRSIETVKSSIVMAFGTAPDADADVFPINTPILLTSQPRKAAKLGTAGTLKDAVDGVYKQDAAMMIVCRVEEGADIFETWGNLLGDIATKAGVWSALSCRTNLGAVPKILIAPGFTGQRVEGAVTAISVTSGGSGQTSAPKVHIYPTDATVNVSRTAAVGNTGNGVMTLATPAYANPVAPGEWTVRCKTAATNGGTFDVIDPDGAYVGTATVGVAYTGKIKFTIADGSTDFVVGDEFAVTVAISGGTGVGAKAEATVVSGAVTAITVKNAGFNFEANPYIALSGGGTTSVSHATATSTIGDAANPIVAELLGVADRLRAVIVAEGPGTTSEDAVVYRGDWGSKRVYIVDPPVLVYDTTLDTPVAKPNSSYVAGVISRMDREKGFWWSPSNQIINGIVGASRPVDFGISDINSDANYLNENEVATIIRYDGYRLWGNRTTATDPLWAFLSVRRTADMVYESIERAFLWALDRPLTRNNILEIPESVNAYLRFLTRQGAILGGTSWLDPEMNTPTVLQSGQLYIDFEIEPPAPLERLTFRAHRNGDYYEEVVDSVIRALSA